MNNINVSLICTLKNEEFSIREFLDSLLSQSKPPDEIIIVDGGSTDGTVDIIRSYIEEGAPIKLIIKNGANIAQGRNIAIENAKYDIIASTDAGCRIDKDWLKNLIKPFEADLDVDVVSGWYEADAKTNFQRCVAELTYPKLTHVINNAEKFLPSSRSVAYKKGCWEKVGGYPEWLYTAEDTLFDLNLKKIGCTFVFAKDAVVYWKVRSNLKNVFKQHYSYAKGNGMANLSLPILLYLRYSVGILLVALSLIYPSILIFLVLALVLYIMMNIKINIDTVKLKKVPIYTLLIFSRDMAIICGYTVGMIHR